MPASSAHPWPLLRALALYLAGAAVFTWPWWSGRVTIPWDAKAHFYPQILFLARALSAGESPFWAPQVFAGHPQIADPQAMILSPPFLGLAALVPAPGFVLVDMMVFAMLVAGGVAVILVFRDRGWHWSGALVAALVFAFGCSAAWRVQHVGQVHSLAWAAITFLLIDRAITRRSVAHGVAAGVAGACLLLGRDQVALLAAYLLIAHVVARLAGPWTGIAARLRATAPALLAGAGVGLVLVALPLMMSIDFGANSNRPSIDLVGAGRGSLHPVHLLTLFVADLYASSGPMADVWGPPSFAWPDTGIFLAQNMFVLYIGAVPVLALVGLGLVGGLAFAREVRPFTIAAAAMLIYALGWYTPVFEALWRGLPGVSLFRRPADATFLFGALLGVVAGYLVHRLATGTVPAFGRVRRALVVVLPLAAYLAALALAIAMGRATANAFWPLVTGAVSLAVAGVLLALLADPARRARQGRALALAVVAFTALDLSWSNGPTGSTGLPPADYAVLAPDSQDATLRFLTERTMTARTATRRDRVELAGLGFHWPNAPLVHDLEHTLGYNPLRYGLYSAAVGANDSIGLPGDRRFTPLFPSYRSPLANLLGLRFIASPIPLHELDKTLAPDALPLIGRPGGAYVYENPDALPRVLLPTGVRVADTAGLVASGAWPVTDFTTEVVLERLPEGYDPRSRGAGRARIVAYHHAEVLVEAEAPRGGGVLLLNDAFHPWWRAEVDGRPAEILRANVLFRGVVVPEGASRVRFLFRPISGVLGRR
jgi:hypothetical protein